LVELRAIGSQIPRQEDSNLQGLQAIDRVLLDRELVSDSSSGLFRNAYFLTSVLSSAGDAGRWPNAIWQPRSLANANASVAPKRNTGFMPFLLKMMGDVKPANHKANLPGSLQRLHAARNRNAALVRSEEHT